VPVGYCAAMQQTTDGRTTDPSLLVGGALLVVGVTVGMLWSLPGGVLLALIGLIVATAPN
jgi:hypothetical protein